MKEVLSSVNVTIEHIKTARTRVVHFNRLQQRLVQGEVEAHGEVPVDDWEVPQNIEHFILPSQQARQAQQAEVGRCSTPSGA